MQVGLVTGKNKVELVDFPEPTLTAEHAIVEISYCGICGTDVHAYQSGRDYNPAICGHEWVGHVSAVGRDVQTCKEGDRVAMGGRVSCGECGPCAAGNSAYCEPAFLTMIGQGRLASTHGGFAPRLAVDGARLFTVAGDMSDADAALLEPATIAMHAVRRSRVRVGDSVVVLGGGPIGLFVVQCAKLAGAGRVVLLEPQPGRRALGLTCGADEVLNPRDDDLREKLAASVGALGADVVFECAGVAATIDQAVHIVRRGGFVSLVGVVEGTAEIVPASWLVKEIDLTTSLAALREEFLITRDLVQDGRLITAPLHTQTLPLSRIAEGFAELASNPEQVKILVDPRAE
ncbi:MAG: zinc-binding dehydrogenase [Pseudomonadota bacterium]